MSVSNGKWINPTWHPCPTCGEDMHPAMERRYGHCGGPYCSGWADALPDAPDHHDAMHGCVGTGEHRPHGFGWYAPGEDPEMLRTPLSCTADDAVIAGVRHD
jgi:hypothetical protein